VVERVNAMNTLTQDLTRQAAELNSQRVALSELERRLARVDLLEGNVQQGMSDVLARSAELTAAREEIRRMHATLEEQRALCDRLDQRSATTTELLAKAEQLAHSMEELDARISQLLAARGRLSEVEQRLDDLPLILEDVKAKVRHFREQEATLDRTLLQVERLESLFGQLSGALQQLSKVETISREADQRIESLSGLVAELDRHLASAQGLTDRLK
jgi:chromosome segregation ATPase